MLWDAALLYNGGSALVPGWQTVIADYAEPVAATSDDVYDWRCDEGFGVLELILTAPVVVASWISLQY
ncbi:hypothetical protein XBLMG947_3831 [Xanthomonas bromi]|uniref:Uncharacterized protein n=1 Tax=Xanthomonas bromi TaxID=56449 RepID=A0A1C3NRQ7_9XANT|nr:hypothetical protein XBLMG947_3831 [Xanthomonas bromi]